MTAVQLFRGSSRPTLAQTPSSASAYPWTILMRADLRGPPGCSGSWPHKKAIFRNLAPGARFTTVPRVGAGTGIAHSAKRATGARLWEIRK